MADVFQGWGVASNSNSIPLNPPSKGGLPIREFLRTDFVRKITLIDVAFLPMQRNF